jgi:uncharacterized small protein (DUF1192 family)
MTTFDGEAFGREIVAELKRVIDPLRDRIAALEAKISRIEVTLEARGEMKYCGIWEEGREYSRGHFTTTAGSLWHAEQTTRSRPGTDATWRLAVKKGTCT